MAATGSPPQPPEKKLKTGTSNSENDGNSVKSEAVISNMAGYTVTKLLGQVGHVIRCVT